MTQNPRNQNTCEVCQQSFNSEQELQTHQNTAHGQNKSGERQSNFDIETDQPKRTKNCLIRYCTRPSRKCWSITLKGDYK